MIMIDGSFIFFIPLKQVGKLKSLLYLSVSLSAIIIYTKNRYIISTSLVLLPHDHFMYKYALYNLDSTFYF